MHFQENNYPSYPCYPWVYFKNFRPFGPAVWLATGHREHIYKCLLLSNRWVCHAKRFQKQRKFFKKIYVIFCNFFCVKDFAFLAKLILQKEVRKMRNFMKRNVQQIHENLQNFALIYFAKNYHVYCEIFHFWKKWEAFESNFIGNPSHVFGKHQKHFLYFRELDRSAVNISPGQLKMEGDTVLTQEEIVIFVVTSLTVSIHSKYSYK